MFWFFRANSWSEFVLTFPNCHVIEAFRWRWFCIKKKRTVYFVILQKCCCTKASRFEDVEAQCDYYSMVAQMCIFAHDVTCDSEVPEGRLDLPSVPGQTKRPRSIQALLGSLQKHSLEPHKLVGTVIDVAISTIGSTIVWNLVYKHIATCMTDCRRYLGLDLLTTLS
jgi:hypothetical protein